MAGYLYTEGLSVGYGGRPLLEHIALSVRRGEIMTLIGPNGAGKSTILKSLSRQLPALAGRVVLDGAPLARLGELELARRMALVTTDRRTVYAEDYYGDGSWWEVGAVRNRVPVYGLKLRGDAA